MKIKNQKDVEALDQKIQNELGVDLKKYRNKEIAENIIELIAFPAYILNWVLRPVGIAFIIYIAGFQFLDLVHIEYFLYGLFGLVFFMLSGVVSGILFLTYKLKSDILAILQYSLDIMKSSIEDIVKVKSSKTADQSNVLGLLFKGIIHIVIIPVLSDVVSNKIPLIGGLITGIIKKLLTAITNKIKFKEAENVIQNESDPSRLLTGYKNTIDATSKGLNTLLSVSTSVIQVPIKIVAFISFSLLLLFLYLIH